MAPETDSFKQRIDASAETAKTLAENAQTQFDQLRSIIELEDAARFGSRRACLTLKKTGTSSGPFGTMANRRISAIERDLLSYHSVPSVLFGLAITRDGKKTDADNLSTAELFMYLESPNMAKEQIPAMMGHIAKKPRHEVCREARSLLERSDSLVACAATCGVLRKVLGDCAPFLAFDEWLVLCEKELYQAEGPDPQK